MSWGGHRVIAGYAPDVVLDCGGARESLKRRFNSIIVPFHLLEIIISRRFVYPLSRQPTLITTNINNDKAATASITLPKD